MIPIALTIAASAGIGFGAHARWGAGARAAAGGVLKTMLFGLTPVIAYLNVASIEVDGRLASLVVAGWLALLGVGSLAWLAGRMLGLSSPGRGALIATTMQGNTGYLGYPVCVALLGSSALGDAVAYDQLVQGPILLTAVFASAAALGTRAGARPSQRLWAFVSRNPPLIATLLGLLAPAVLVPARLVEASHVLVYLLVPLGFFAVGVTLASERVQGARVRPQLSSGVVCSLGLRVVVAPLALLACTAPLGLPPTAWLLSAAMPSGINGLVVAHAYGLDLRLTASAIACSTGVVVAVATVATLMT